MVASQRGPTQRRGHYVRGANRASSDTTRIIWGINLVMVDTRKLPGFLATIHPHAGHPTLFFWQGGHPLLYVALAVGASCRNVPAQAPGEVTFSAGENFTIIVNI